jgi:hypothetical protein
MGFSFESVRLKPARLRITFAIAMPNWNQCSIAVLKAF